MDPRIKRALQDWHRLRPYLYHFAPLRNIREVIRRREMLSATRIVQLALSYDPTQLAEPEVFLSTPRNSSFPLRIGREEADLFVLNDQLPMTRGNCFANLDCTPQEFVATLNNLVFFWPGNAEGPRTKGRHASSFRSRYPQFAAIRFRFADVHNRIATLKFCGCNSGAPQQRDRIRRSPAIFRSFDEPAIVGQAVEVVAEGNLRLPETVEYREHSQSPWIPVGRTPDQLL